MLEEDAVAEGTAMGTQMAEFRRVGQPRGPSQHGGGNGERDAGGEQQGERDHQMGREKEQTAESWPQLRVTRARLAATSQQLLGPLFSESGFLHMDSK